MMKKRNVEAGFTLIETLVYIALLAFIMSGSVFAAYNLIEGAGRLNADAAIQEEGNFVMRKIDWALSSASGFNTSVARQLTVYRYDDMAVVITLSGTEVRMSEDGGANFAPITTGNVTATDLSFTTVGTPPRLGVTATLLLNGTAFSTTNYMRK